MLTLISNSLAETERLGNKIGENLPQGTIILLSGEMGSGKTTLTKSICASQGIDPMSVTSPTYTIANVYEAEQNIHHVDLYRLNSEDELDGFDRDDLISPDGLTLIEWPEFIEPLLGKEPLLSIKMAALSDNERQLVINFRQGTFDTLQEALKNDACLKH